MERRRLLNAGAGFTLAAVAGQTISPSAANAAAAGTARATGAVDTTGTAEATGTVEAGHRCSGEPVSTYGVASLTAAIVGTTVLGNHAYVVARGQNPTRVGEIDLTTRKLTRSFRLTRGDGGWAATVSGGHVYIGSYPFPDIHRIDPATGTVTRIGTIGPAGGFVWCLATAPDGTVYAGTHPRGEVWEYKPQTGTLRNLGAAMAGEQYVRAIAADDRYVYAGTLPRGYVIAYDRATGAKRNITPTPYGGAAALLAHGGRVLGSLGRTIVDLAPDGSDARAIMIPAAERIADAITVMPDGALYCVGRPTGTVYRREGDRLVAVAAPATGDEHRALIPLGKNTMLGAVGSGRLWWLDLPTKKSEIVELIDIGLSGPDPVQSIAYQAGGTVHVGGHYSLTTHRPSHGTSKRIRIPGEPKQLRVVGGRVYAAMYPSTEFLEIDPRRGKIRSMGFIDNDQQRPTDMAYVPEQDLLLVASAPPAGGLKGALTLVERSRGRLTVHKDVITDQSVMSVALDDRVGHRTAYLAGDTWGGGSVTPARPHATVVAFDLRRRTVLWEATPIEGHASIQHIEVHDGILYGLYKRRSGTWFAMDLESRTVIKTGKLPSYGEISVHFGQVYASVFGGSVYRLGPGSDDAQLVLGGLGDGWYNPPQLAWERATWHAWGVATRDLARLRLDPLCPSGLPAEITAQYEAVLKGLLAN
ncbi:hypothetical protein QWM81_00625 [Streptomyces ficellus]|uniref:WD40 repeat domain-containing protein n=1 Tax=Streptomyces ficellus TaxID=1977088 RepID=A0ABT7YZY8_9ACTN|nr:hypothetical protein [Streptomyces ficellus]MDN3292572.1 hypothetical protein [Streptomyces ficellus]